MKKVIFAFVIISLALFSACGGNEEDSPSPSPSFVPTQTLIPTSPPDYSNVDFSGRWQLSALIAPDGSPASSIPPKGYDFILELALQGDYFVYDAKGSVLGQGRWSINGDSLVLSGGGETDYTIVNADTLRAEASDGSATIMSRQQDDQEQPENTEPEAEISS